MSSLHLRSPRSHHRACRAGGRIARRGPSLLAVGLALAGCEAELVSAFEDAPVFELVDDQLDEPVQVILLATDGATLLLGGPRGGPAFMVRDGGATRDVLPPPRGDRSPVAADASGGSLWAVGPGFAWDGPPEALGARELPRAGLELTDVSVRPGGGLVAAGGPGSLVLFRPGEPARLVPLATTASAGLSAVHVATDRQVFLGAASGLLGAWTPPSGPLRALDGPDAEIRALDGAGDRVYAVGGADAGFVGEIVSARVRDLSVGGMPPLDHVVAEDGAVWVASRGGFVARFDGRSWRAFELPLGTRRLEGMVVQSRDAVWLAGGDPSGAGWWGRFRTRRLVE